MTVSELIELLEQYDGEAEVRIATQPSWPFEHGLRGVVGTDDLNDLPDEAMLTVEPEGQEAVWLVEGAQQRYLPGAVAAKAWE